MPTTIYCIKYALTKGIFKTELIEIRPNGNCVAKYPNTTNNKLLLFKGDWFANLEEAKENANKKVSKEINRLQNKIKRLEKLTF